MLGGFQYLSSTSADKHWRRSILIKMLVEQGYSVSDAALVSITGELFITGKSFEAAQSGHALSIDERAKLIQLHIILRLAMFIK